MVFIEKNASKLRELALFAGIGGGILGGKLLGWECKCAVEIEPWNIGVLLQRQNDGILNPFPIWDDVTTFNGMPWHGLIDVISGGFPCQDISSAARNPRGILGGKKSILWKEMPRIICEVQPTFTFIENSPMLVSRGLDVILSDLAKIGYNAVWDVVSGENVGAGTKRERLWILGVHKKQQNRKENINTIKKSASTYEKLYISTRSTKFRIPSFKEVQKISNKFLTRKIDDVPRWLERSHAIGNAQIPSVAKTAWLRLMYVYWVNVKDTLIIER